MKNILGMLLLVVLGTSCATGYGCPYSGTEKTEIAPKNVDEPFATATIAVCEP
jgi:hypothetical protein